MSLLALLNRHRPNNGQPRPNPGQHGSKGVNAAFAPSGTGPQPLARRLDAHARPDAL